MNDRQKCALYFFIAWFNGGFFGALAGLFLGGWIGALLGAGIGGCVGAVVGAVWCWLDDIFDGKRFAVPTLKANLSATPGPVKVGNPCRIAAGFNYAGNSDNALCTVTYNVWIEDGTPGNAPPDPTPYTSNGPDWGAAFPVFDTKWAKQSDGKRVVLTVVLTATLNNKTVLVSDKAETTVVVLP